MFSCLYKILIDGNKSNEILETVFTILAKSSVLWFSLIIFLTEPEIRSKLSCFKLPIAFFSLSQIESPTNSSDKKNSKSQMVHI